MSYLLHLNAKAKLINYCSLLLIVLWFSPSLVYADDASISNEETGAGSENQASIEINQSTQVEQTNESTVVNVIDLGMNTGSNQANENIGDAQVTTGDINSDVDVSTETNVNEIDLTNNSSNGNESEIIVNNQQTGVDSNNQAEVKIENQTLIATQNQQLVINEVDIKGNTGKNQANGNNGNVQINTGDMVVDTELETTGNFSSIKGLSQCTACTQKYQLTAINVQTGAGSKNQTSIQIDQETVIVQENNRIVLNKITGDFNTGGNVADENNGDVTIHTGDIILHTDAITIGNENLIVASELIAYAPPDPSDPIDHPEVGGPDDPDDDPAPASLPATNNSSSGGSSGNSSSGSSSSSGSVGSAVAVGGQVLGAMLPLTGNAYTFVFWMLGLFLISMGRFVRLLSGRAPSELAIKF